jgi:hypothetical protein
MKKRPLFATPVALLMTLLICGPLVTTTLADDPAKTGQSPPRAAPARTGNSRALPVPQGNAEEDRILRALAKPTQIEFVDLPLSDALHFLAEFHCISIRIDAEAVHAAEIPVDTPVTLKRDQVSFQRIANLLLAPLGLDWYIAGKEFIVTTRDAAAEASHHRVEKLLEPELQLVDHVCELTDAQRDKLQLAVRGEIRRLSGGIAERAQKLPLSRSDEQRVNDVCRELEQLQRDIQSGPFGKGSLFRKALETTLTAEQMVKYDPIRAVIQAGGLVGTLQRGSDVILGVHLTGASFSDDDLARFKGFSVLGYLRIDGTEVTDTGMASLKDLVNLQELALGDTRVGDIGLASLKELKNLRVLSLRGTAAVTDAGLVHLHGLTNLQELDLTATKVTDDGIADLKRAVPNLEISR